MTGTNYEVFSEVALQNSFSKAANTLHLTRSAVSHSISTLEENWGFPLFIREKNGVSITEEGRTMLPLVREILQKEELITEQAAGIRGKISGKVTVAVFSSICIRYIPELLAGIRNQYPEARIRIMQGDYQDVCDWVRSGVADIGFESLPFASDLVETPLFTDQLVCVAPAGFVPQNKESVGPGDLESHELIIQQRGYSIDTMDYIRLHHLQVRASHYLDDDRAILTMVACGQGLSLVPELALAGREEMRGLSLWPLEFPFERQIGLLTRNRSALSPTAKKIMKLITEMCR